MCAGLVAALTPQLASAVLLTNTVRNIQARNVRATIAAGTGVASGETYSFVNGSIRNQYTQALGGQTGKAWIQFDLTSIWAFYGQSNLTSATLALWNANGNSRQFWVAGIADSAGLDGWDQNTLTWSNAPANELSNLSRIGYAWDYSKCFGGTNVWEVNSGSLGVDVSVPSNTQGAYYVSTNATSKVYQFLTNDVDGKVTFTISDGPNNLNQTVLIGTNGVYAGSQLAANGIPTKDSPLLTLVFDVRVALTGGGNACPGGSGVNVLLAGSDTGFVYLLYTNGVFSGQTVTGTGGSVSFGPQNTIATYTAVASNVVTTATTLLPGAPQVTIFGAPGIAVQPTTYTAATNSVALFNLTATNTGGGITYQWYRNGTLLTDDGHFSGATSNQLMISPVLATDAATAANGYYCVVANPCGLSAISSTNALTVQVARNLVWQGTPSNTWDIATTANWTNSSGTAVTFNQGDNVTLDSTAQNAGVVLASPYLSPGVITFNANGVMGIGGSGNISGPNSSLVVNGPTGTSELVITNANTFGGGTTINDGWLLMRNLGAVGTNTIKMAGTGLSLLEVLPSGSASTGIPGVNVVADSKLVFDGTGAFAGVMLGQLTGTAGKTLTVNAPNAGVGANVRFYGNFVCNNNIVMDLGGANWASYQTGDSTYNGVVSGNCILYPRAGNTILSGANTFTQTTLSQGNVGVGIDSNLGAGNSPLGLGTVTTENAGDCAIFASGGARTIENPFAWTTANAPANRILIFNGSNQLTWSGTIDLSAGGAVSTNRTIRVDNTAPTILSGVIGDTGQNCGLNKTGNGALYLNAANTYTGSTTNSAGLLAGSGSIAGSVFVTATNAAIGGGTSGSIGSLTINGNLTLAGGGGFFRVNGGSSDSVSVVGSLANTGTGTIVVTNLGVALTAGQSFPIFNKAMTGGNAMNITGAGVTWTNKLAVDGSIVVGPAVSTIANYSTNITLNVSGSTITLNWPTTHLGWILQSQTNSLSNGLNTNWVDVAGSSSVTSAIITANPATPSVFYRLRHP